MDHTAFAHEWEAAWNSHDLDRILSHYSEDIEFRSRKAEHLFGNGFMKGKHALRIYWAKALEMQPDLRFEVLEVFSGFEMTVIRYRNHKGIVAAETLRFGKNGAVVEASACHASG